MRFGTFHLMTRPQGATSQQIVQETLAEAELAEELGFDCVWLTEHHASDHGICSAPSVFAAAVVEPMATYSLAAEGVIMLYDAASKDLLSLSGQGVAPGKATVDFYRSQGLDTIPTGPGPQAHLSFTLPGVVHAITALLERYGTKTLAEALAPSIHYAEHGIPNYE